MTTREEQLKEAARGAIERYAEWDEEASADTIYDECYCLAFDHLVDKQHCSQEKAREIAAEVAQLFAQP